MVKEVLTVIKDLSKDITSIIVSHEISFVQDVATNIIFMEDGKIIEKGKTDYFFGNLQNSRIKDFLDKIN